MLLFLQSLNFGVEFLFLVNQLKYFMPVSNSILEGEKAYIWGARGIFPAHMHKRHIHLF